MSVDYRLIGRRIQKKRKSLGKTQEDLAEELSVSVGYISQLERGVTKISLDTLAKISSVLECDLGFFITGSVVEQNDYLQDELIKKISALNTENRKILLDIADILIRNARK